MEKAKILKFGQPLKHYAVINPRKHYFKPEEKEMGMVTNAIKRIKYAQPYNARELLQHLGSGHCVSLCNFTLNEKNQFVFLSTTAFTIDVDDIEMVTNPKEVLEKSNCTGMFYTFSHGREGKGNRFRLFFQLDQAITDLEEYKKVVQWVQSDLKRSGIPVDGSGALLYPYLPIRPGVLGYEINDLSLTLSVSEIMPKATAYAEEQNKIRLSELKNKSDSFHDTILEALTFEELKEMCEAIGYIPSKQGEEITRKWLQIVYALKNEVNIGNIDETQGFELYSIVSGSEANVRYWNNIKPRGQVTVGTVIKYAKESGYKRKHKYRNATGNSLETIPVEHLKVKDRLDTQTVKKLIQRNQRLLVDSPTGSGKTYCTIDAFKELHKEDFANNDPFHYYIFSTPTIPLTEQVAKNYGVFCVTGGMKNLNREVDLHAFDGGRVFVCTYDKTAETIRILEEVYDYEGKTPKFTVVIDEMHKFTEAYNYRYAAIDKIKSIASKTISFIGISGTCEDILKDDFEALIKVDTGNSKSPCSTYRVFTYEKRDDADAMLIPLVRILLKKTKVMLFINNKKRIKRIRDILRKEEIKVQIVTSDSKKSPTYLDIIEKEHIDDDIQVLITTSVLADGVSIQNGFEWSCLVVSDIASPIFNPSTVKQISNRFRQEYALFGLYIQAPNPKHMETDKFNIENEYRYRKKVVSKYVDYLNKEFQEDGLKSFVPSVIEKYNGIYYKSQEEGSTIRFNHLFVRHQSMKRKENYYNLFKNAFIHEVGVQLGVKLKGIYNVNEEAEKDGSDLSKIFETLEAIQEQEKLDNAELRQAYSDYFDEDVYQAFLGNDTEILEVFKAHVHPEQFSATMKNVWLTDFETCKTVGEKVRRKADVNSFSNHIKALAEIATFDFVKKTTISKKVFNELLKMVGETYLSSDLKDLIGKKLPKKLKVQPKDVKEGLQLFHAKSRKSNGNFFTTLEPLSVEVVATIYGISEKDVKNSILKYVWSKNGQQQNILLPSIQQKWSIETYEK